MGISGLALYYRLRFGLKCCKRVVRIFPSRQQKHKLSVMVRFNLRSHVAGSWDMLSEDCKHTIQLQLHSVDYITNLHSRRFWFLHCERTLDGLPRQKNLFKCRIILLSVAKLHHEENLQKRLESRNKHQFELPGVTHGAKTGILQEGGKELWSIFHPLGTQFRSSEPADGRKHVWSSRFALDLVGNMTFRVDVYPLRRIRTLFNLG